MQEERLCPHCKKTFFVRGFRFCCSGDKENWDRESFSRTRLDVLEKFDKLFPSSAPHHLVIMSDEDYIKYRRKRVQYLQESEVHHLVIMSDEDYIKYRRKRVQYLQESEVKPNSSHS